MKAGYPVMTFEGKESMPLWKR